MVGGLPARTSCQFSIFGFLLLSVDRLLHECLCRPHSTCDERLTVHQECSTWQTQLHVRGTPNQSTADLAKSFEMRLFRQDSFREEDPLSYSTACPGWCRMMSTKELLPCGATHQLEVKRLAHVHLENGTAYRYLLDVDSGSTHEHLAACPDPVARGSARMTKLQGNECQWQASHHLMHDTDFGLESLQNWF